MRFLKLPMTRRFTGGIAATAAAIALVAGAAHATQPPADSSARLVVVAFADKPDPVPGAGATPRGYSMNGYSEGGRATRIAARVVREHALREVSAWTIAPLRLRCLLLEIPPDADREALLARLRADPRIEIAQPLQEFTTLGLAAPVDAEMPAYNDPYVGLQRGFAAIGAGAAQRWSDGSGVRIALIDTGVDASHPDLAARIAVQRDFVARSRSAATDQHGTEVAGVIAAIANNGVGIVGVAPGARIQSYRSCWTPAADARARCDSFTLALGLAAAIEGRARIINLSLGGPPDPLLERLTAHAIGRGILVVGAVPPSGRMDGFPLNVDGVLGVRAIGDLPAHGAALNAPGREILTLREGGRYEYVSGSSLAAAHVSASIALLLQLRPRLDRAAIHALLAASQPGPDAPIDICVALDRARDSAGGCTRGRTLHETAPAASAPD